MMPLLWSRFALLGLVANPLIQRFFKVHHRDMGDGCNEGERQARVEPRRSGMRGIMFVGGTMISVTTTAAGRIGEAIFPFALYWPHIERMTSTTLADIVPTDWRSAILATNGYASALTLVLIDHRSSVRRLLSSLSWLRADCSLACGDHTDGHALADDVMTLLRRRGELAEGSAHG
jgi:hypothetical protein